MTPTTQQNITIHPASRDDLPAILALLKLNNLPEDGLSEHMGTTLIATKDSEIIGCAALEIYGNDALLRSVAIQKELQGYGLGTQLTQAALDYAGGQNIKDVYLLTETAGDFFPRFGFQTVTRAHVPASVAQSVEFTTACPQSALVMLKHI